MRKRSKSTHVADTSVRIVGSADFSAILRNLVALPVTDLV